MEELIVSSVRFLGALPMFVSAACLILFNRGKLQSAVYNRSRWFIAAATLILGIHQEQPLACFQVAGGHDASRMGGRKQQEITHTDYQHFTHSVVAKKISRQRYFRFMTTQVSS